MARQIYTKGQERRSPFAKDNLDTLIGNQTLMDHTNREFKRKKPGRRFHETLESTPPAFMERPPMNAFLLFKALARGTESAGR